MGRHRELMFDFIVTTQAKIRFTDSQQLNRRETGFFRICGRDESIRAGEIFPEIAPCEE